MIEFEIKKHVKVLKEYNGNCKKELTLTSWNGQPEKYDIRIWKDGKPAKGITLSEDELKVLASALSDLETHVESDTAAGHEQPAAAAKVQS